jgi:hypothetical protein
MYIAALRSAELRLGCMLESALDDDGEKGRLKRELESLASGMRRDMFIRLKRLSRGELITVEKNSSFLYSCIVGNRADIDNGLAFNTVLGGKLQAIGEYINTQYNPDGNGEERDISRVNSFKACTVYIWLIAESVRNIASAKNAFNDGEVVQYVRDTRFSEHLLLHHIISNMKAAGLF